jgi:ketosteroid isomerase-like protein
MSDTNVAVIRSMYEAFRAGDLERALAHYSEDVVVDPTRGRIDMEVGHGREAVAATVGSWVAAFDDWREEIHEIRGFGERVYVAATQYGRGKGSGVAVETWYAVVYELREGLIARFTMFGDRDEALRAAAGTAG